jgi:dihydropteroate synthase
MHMQGQPDTMQAAPSYDNVVADVRAFLQQRTRACLAAGIAADRIVLDPGFGFGKTLQQNLTLFNQLAVIGGNNTPVLVGVSRKSMIGSILDRKAPEERVAGGLALAMLAVQHGAKIIRTHDVAETVDVIRMLQALEENSKQ